MKITNRLFVAITVCFLLGVSAIAQAYELYGLATPVGERVERGEVDIQSVLYKIDP